MAFDKVKQSIRNKIKNNKFFANTFGFESGIDITNDDEVLHRKNTVIKNIIFITNILYTMIFTILSFGEKSNWLLTILLFPVTFVVNMCLKKMINKGKEDKMSQTIAMYFACFYNFLSSILIYFKLKSGDSAYISECGYILIYYSLTVCAFYQDKKLLKNVCMWVFVLITILHFTITYPILNDALIKNPLDFFNAHKNALTDILIRTILLVLYMVVLYATVAMVNYMQQERKKELQKRREVQENFTNVVTKIFDVTLDRTMKSSTDNNDVLILSIMAKKLASLLGMPPSKCDLIEEFAKVHITNNINLSIDDNLSEDEKFDYLRCQTQIGSRLIERIQLERKCEDIIRATFEGADDEAFVKRMRDIQNQEDAQIILICDLYVTMRSVKSYKKAYKHSLTIEYFKEHFNLYFDPMILDRFIKFSNDFENIYNES